MRCRVVITRVGGYDPTLGPKHPDNRDTTLEAHVTDVGVARSDEPDDAYFWRCSCGRMGPLTLNARSARNGGARHVAAMEKR
jgi:hypothetical protein